MEFPTVACFVPSHVNPKSTLTSSNEKPPPRSFKKQTSTIGEKNTKTSVMESFREK